MEEDVNIIQMSLERYSQKVRNRRAANDCDIPEVTKAR